MFWNKPIKTTFREYFLLNRFSTEKRKQIEEITPLEIIKQVEKLSLKQREQLGTYGL